MRSIARLAVAAVLALGSAWIPLQAALACSCAFTGFPEAVASADYSFVGTVVAADEPMMAMGMGTARYAFEVTEAKAPMASPFEVDATFGGDANCGFDMAVGEEWLVIASVHDGRPQTNLCQGTMRTADLDADTRLVLDAALDPNDAAAAPESELALPMPILVAGGALLALGAISLLAFRRESR